MTRRNVQKVLAKLEAKGVIRRDLGGRGPGNSTQYELLPVPGAVAVGNIRANDGTPLGDEARANENDVRVNARAPKDKSPDHKERTDGRPNLNNHTDNPETVCVDTHTAGFDTLDWNEKRPLTDAQIDFHFEEFWKHCPRAVAKAKAQAIYRKVVRSGKASIDKLLHAMMQYAAARDEADQDEYTKSPATWLEEGCWDDDPAAHALGSGRHRFSRLWQKMKAGGFDFSPETRPRPPPKPEPAPPDPRWRKIQDDLAAELDEITYKRFFSQTEFQAIDEGVVYLRTPAPINARIIKREYEQTLVEHWQANDPTVKSIVVEYGQTFRRTGS